MAFTLKKHTSNQLESARLNDVNQNWTDIETAIDALQTDVDENFGRLEAEVDLLKGEVISVASHSVTESGSNANGTWIKYADGRMECYLVKDVENFTLSYALGTTGVAFNYYEWTYPKPFISVPHVAVGRAQVGSGAQWGSTRQNTSTNAQAVVWGALGNTGLLNITLHATGRWK